MWGCVRARAGVGAEGEASSRLSKELEMWDWIPGLWDHDLSHSGLPILTNIFWALAVFHSVLPLGIQRWNHCLQLLFLWKKQNKSEVCKKTTSFQFGSCRGFVWVRLGVRDPLTVGQWVHSLLRFFFWFFSGICNCVIVNWNATSSCFHKQIINYISVVITQRYT